MRGVGGLQPTVPQPVVQHARHDAEARREPLAGVHRAGAQLDLLLAARRQQHPGGDAPREVATSWDFREVNQLIHEHNEWYPVERDLPMNPRTKDYVLINGHSYRREVLGPDWILARFPAEP